MYPSRLRAASQQHSSSFETSTLYTVSIDQCVQDMSTVVGFQRTTPPQDEWTGAATQPQERSTRKSNGGKEETSSACGARLALSAGAVAACVRSTGFRFPRLRGENSGASNPPRPERPFAPRRTPETLAAHSGCGGTLEGGSTAPVLRRAVAVM